MMLEVTVLHKICQLARKKWEIIKVVHSTIE
jgi:hypothetical protein